MSAGSGWLPAPLRAQAGWIRLVAGVSPGWRDRPDSWHLSARAEWSHPRKTTKRSGHMGSWHLRKFPLTPAFYFRPSQA